MVVRVNLMQVRFTLLKFGSRLREHLLMVGVENSVSDSESKTLRQSD